VYTINSVGALRPLIRCRDCHLLSFSLFFSLFFTGGERSARVGTGHTGTRSAVPVGYGALNSSSLSLSFQCGGRGQRSVVTADLPAGALKDCHLSRPVAWDGCRSRLVCAGKSTAGEVALTVGANPSLLVPPAPTTQLVPPVYLSLPNGSAVHCWKQNGRSNPSRRHRHRKPCSILFGFGLIALCSESGPFNPSFLTKCGLHF